MYLTITPPPILRPFVKVLWTVDGTTPNVADSEAWETVLPSGLGHIAVRVSDQPFRFARDGDRISPGSMVACGPRTAPYIRKTGEAVISVGAQLQPGACSALFGTPANLMAEQHLALDDLWGLQAFEIQDRLAETTTAAERLTLFADFLTRRLKRSHGLHPAVALALQRFAFSDDVTATVRETDYSHRHFNALFRHDVGMSAKRYCRLLRFKRSLERLGEVPAASAAGLAIDMGYSDQAHFNRDFRDFAGMTPGDYRRRQPQSTFHVPHPGE